jgi:hypothetical protein
MRSRLSTARLAKPQLDTAALMRVSAAVVKSVSCPPSEWPIMPIRARSTSGRETR